MANLVYEKHWKREQRQKAWTIIANAWLRESHVSGVNITTKVWKLEGLLANVRVLF